MPKPSIGAPARSSAATLSSSSPPLAKILTSRRPPSSRMRAHRPRQCREIAAVEAHGADRDAVGLEPRRERDHLPGAGLGVVGVDQQRQVVAAATRAKASNAAASSS